MGWQDAPIIEAGATAAAATPKRPSWESAPVVNEGGFLQHVGNLAAGAIRGAGSIGATLLAPVDVISDAIDGKGLTLESNRQRRADMDGALQELGAQPDSAMYGAGKLAGEIAGTLPVGGLVGRGIAAVGAPRLGAAVASAGFRTGAPAATTLAERAADMGIRAAGGAISGGATAAATDPEHAIGGATVGAVAPGAIRVTHAALGAAGRAAGATGRGVRAAIEPFTEGGRQAIASRVLAQAAGDEAPAVAARLAQAGELVPGSIPTAGQVAENGGVAALERAMAASQPAPFTERALDQSAARLAALREVAGDAGQRELFTAARQQAANELYQQAFAQQLTLQGLPPHLRGEIRDLMGMPAVQDAVRAARENARNRGIELGDGGSVRGLHEAKLAMDDAISKLTGTGAAQENRARAIQSARDRLLAFIEEASPAYREARATYAEMSRPVNQLDTGQALLEKLQPALGEYGASARENSAAYAHALRNGDQIARRATGRDLRMEQVLTPEQRQITENIARDLARKANAQDLGRGVGSNTYQNLSMGNLASRTGLPPKVAAALPAAAGAAIGSTIGGAVGGVPGGIMGAGLGKALQALYGNAEGRVQELVGQSMLHPRTAAQLMEQELARRALAAAPRRPLLSPSDQEAIRVLFGRTSPVLLSGQ